MSGNTALIAIGVLVAVAAALFFLSAWNWGRAKHLKGAGGIDGSSLASQATPKAAATVTADPPRHAAPSQSVAEMPTGENREAIASADPVDEQKA